MTSLFLQREAEASCKLDGETHTVVGLYDHLVEPTAIVLHSFDPAALEGGEAWSDCDTDRKDAFRFMADCVLHAIVPSVERVCDREHTEGRA